MLKKFSSVLIIVIPFIFLENLQFFFTKLPFYNSLYKKFPYYVPETLVSLLQVIIPLIIVMLFLKAKFVNAIKFLGINREIIKGFTAALIITVPMSLLYFFGNGISGEPKLSIAYLALISPFAEEVLFRGFAFGILHKELKLNWLLAAVFVGVFFGLGHVTLGYEILNTLPVFAITTLGSIFFSWLYIRWNTLWVPVFVHSLMNFYWIVFSVADGAFGGVFPTIIQLATLVLGITITLLTVKKHKQKLTTTDKNI